MKRITRLVKVSVGGLEGCVPGEEVVGGAITPKGLEILRAQSEVKTAELGHGKDLYPWERGSGPRRPLEEGLIRRER